MGLGWVGDGRCADVETAEVEIGVYVGEFFGRVDAAECTAEGVEHFAASVAAG